jgi:hypothetical protein
MGSGSLIDMLLVNGHDWNQAVDIKRQEIGGYEDCIDPIRMSLRTFGSERNLEGVTFNLLNEELPY